MKQQQQGSADQRLEDDAMDVDQESSQQQKKDVQGSGKAMSGIEERRKRTLIFKGLTKVDPQFVSSFLAERRVFTPEEIISTYSKQLGGRNWVWVTVGSTEQADEGFGKRSNLRGSGVFVQRDLSYKERQKRKKEAASYNRGDQSFYRGTHPYPYLVPHLPNGWWGFQAPQENQWQTQSRSSRSNQRSPRRGSRWGQ
jgi:hypothetical protein